MWHVNPLLGKASNTHMANNIGAVFSLCPCSLLNDVTQQYWSSVFYVVCVRQQPVGQWTAWMVTMW
jgi:hypothetical protein